MPALPAARAGVSVYRLTAGEWEALSQDPSPEGVMAVAAALPAVDPAGPLATGSGTLLLPAGLHGDYAADDIGSFPESLKNIRFGLKFTLDDGAFQYAIEDRTQAVDTHHHRWK